MAEKYNTLLIGCGDMGSQHFEALLQHPRIGDLHVADPEIDKIHSAAQSIEERLGSIKPYETTTDYHTFLQCADLAIIAAPPSLHREIVEDCFKAGIDVLCEKPIATTVQDGKSVIQAVRDTNRCLTIGFILRFNETYRRLKDFLDKGTVGELRAVNTYYYKQADGVKWGILLGLIKETSPVIDCGSHYVDVYRWFTGSEPREIKAFGARTEESCPADKYNVGVVELLMENNVVCTHRVAWEKQGNKAAWLNGRKPGVKVELIGSKGSISVSYPVSGKGRGDCDDVIVYGGRGLQLYSHEVRGSYKPLEAQLNRLTEFVEGRKPREDMFEHLNDALRSLDIVLEADGLIRNPGGR